MMSLKSVKMKLGTKEPLTEEVKQCELKLPMEIKRTAASIAEGVSQPGQSHLATTSRRRGSLLPFEGRSPSEA
jgi:hypothetical protein